MSKQPVLHHRRAGLPLAVGCHASQWGGSARWLYHVIPPAPQIPPKYPHKYMCHVIHFHKYLQKYPHKYSDQVSVPTTMFFFLSFCRFFPSTISSKHKCCFLTSFFDPQAPPCLPPISQVPQLTRIRKVEVGEPVCPQWTLTNNPPPKLHLTHEM